jgi:hypothetical protein
MSLFSALAGGFGLNYGWEVIAGALMTVFQLPLLLFSFPLGAFTVFFGL